MQHQWSQNNSNTFFAALGVRFEQHSLELVRTNSLLAHAVVGGGELATFGAWGGGGGAGVPHSGAIMRQLLGTADTQTAHHAIFSTVPTHQLLGSANAETTPAGTPAAAADRKQRPDATCEGKNG